MTTLLLPCAQLLPVQAIEFFDTRHLDAAHDDRARKKERERHQSEQREPDRGKRNQAEDQTTKRIHRPGPFSRGDPHNYKR